jgi:hypothetical protein
MAKTQPVRLNFKPVECAKRDFVECVLKYSNRFKRHKGDLEHAKSLGDEEFIKSYGFDMKKLFEKFGEPMLSEINTIIDNKDAPNREQVIEEMISHFEKQPEFQQAFENAGKQAKKVQHQTPRIWEKHKGQVNKYATDVLGLGDLEIGETTVSLGCGFSTTTKGNRFSYGGGSQNDHDEKDTTRECLHEWLHCVEFDQQLDHANGKAGRLTHFALGMFERYFYSTKLGGEKIDEYLQHWCNDMKYDFLSYMTRKGEKQEDVIKFLENHGMEIDMQQIKTGDSNIENFIEFRNKWHGIEQQRMQAKKEAENADS